MNTKLNNSGFTLIEIILAITLLATMTGFTFPKIREVMVSESLRSARRDVVTHLAQARGAAAQRGCAAVVHMTEGSNARVWVTTCALNGGAGVDTVGMVDHLSTRLDVTVTATADSVVFAPTGIALSWAGMSMTFSKNGDSESLDVTPLGRAEW